MEAKLLDEFVPEERMLNKCEAVIRVFNQYGNRRNKNMARLKFLVRDRGFRLVARTDRKGIPEHPDEWWDRLARDRA